jgi:hypothetical protein
MEDFGSITQLEAIEQLGVMRLASRISDLRGLGIAIKKETVSSKNRYGDKVSYAKYSLEDKFND